MSDDRTKKSKDDQRRSRAAESNDREDSGLAKSEEQLRTELRNEFVHEALPTPPEIAGYHLCWLSTTNSYDPIHKRMRLGYTPVRPDEILGFNHFKQKSAEYGDIVQCNEMLLFKIPMEQYQRIMTVFHHDAPRDEEVRIKDGVNRLVEQARDSEGKSLGINQGEGFEELGKQRKVPIFE